MLEIDGMFVPISKNEEEFFFLEEFLKAEKSIRLTYKRASRD
jgi:hypothetical protein